MAWRLLLCGTVVLFFSQAAGAATQENIPKLPNPTTFPTIRALLEAVIQVVMYIGIPVSVFFIIWSGLLFVTARGDTKQLDTARKMFLWAVAGAAIILGAWVLAGAASGTVEQIKGSA